jgi:hypothetical protein
MVMHLSGVAITPFASVEVTTFISILSLQNKIATICKREGFFYARQVHLHLEVFFYRLV